MIGSRVKFSILSFVLNIPSSNDIFSVIIFYCMKMDTLWWLILEVKSLTSVCFIMLEQKQLSQVKNLGSKITFMPGKKPESFRILKKNEEEIVTISQSLIKSGHVNFFVQMVRSSGFKMLFGSLKILLMSINSFSAVIIKPKVGKTKY